MDKLKQILKAEVKKYAGAGVNCYLFPFLDDENQHYAVNAVDYPTRTQTAGVVVMARLVNDKIIIEEDLADKKLVDALIQQGIPREQIVLAYAGEAQPHLSNL